MGAYEAVLDEGGRPAEVGPASAPLAQRLAALRDGAAYRNYETVLAHVLRMKALARQSAGDVAAPSRYWSEELANFDYMFDASPLIVEKLRHHCHHITGLRLYDYRSNRDRAAELFREKLDALVALGGRELLVPESRILGGFGFEIDGALYNIDTLKFYEALIALKRGAVLDELASRARRWAVWEIGAGWGGFAYQFKRLCPDVTYIITDFPELFLFSAVYLMTAFPGAQVAFFGDGPGGGLPDGWEEADFVFMPHTHLDGFATDRLRLTVNMVSFQEMTSGQVEAYVQRAHELGSSYLYSLNRDRSPYNPEIKSVRPIIERWYWPHEVAVLPVSYTKMLDKLEQARTKKAKKEGAAAGPDLDYRHVIGWRRIKP